MVTLAKPHEAMEGAPPEEAALVSTGQVHEVVLRQGAPGLGGLYGFVAVLALALVSALELSQHGAPSWLIALVLGGTLLFLAWMLLGDCHATVWVDAANGEVRLERRYSMMQRASSYPLTAVEALRLTEGLDGDGDRAWRPVLVLTCGRTITLGPLQAYCAELGGRLRDASAVLDRAKDA